jgi:hypothetical protein
MPLGDTRKGMLKYEFHNRHRCFCGNKKKLLIAEESTYYIWDMECFTDPVVVREGDAQETPMIVREHKPIFVAACNMADPSDRFSFYGEDGLDEFLKFVLQDKKFKKTTFLAHNAGGYDCQFVLRWLERHGQKPDTVPSPSPSSLYRPLQLAYDNVRFIDSWTFITIPLSKFGKCFGLSQSKPDFPHAFSLRENLDYRGPMPGVETEEDWYSLKHIKGSNAHETKTTRINMIRYLNMEATCHISEDRLGLQGANHEILLARCGSASSWMPTVSGDVYDSPSGRRRSRDRVWLEPDAC